MRHYKILSTPDEPVYRTPRPWVEEIVTGRPADDLCPGTVLVDKPFGLPGTWSASASRFMEITVTAGFTIEERIVKKRVVVCRRCRQDCTYYGRNPKPIRVEYHRCEACGSRFKVPRVHL